MNRNAKRLLLALISSGACFFATVVWFKSGARAGKHNDGKPPIARLGETKNEVQRREAKRVIWESIGRDEDLFAGERVRTAIGSEAQIVLLKSGAVMHLDPDSEVVLEESANGLAVDFLSGNLFVQGGGEGVTLKAGASEIALNSADLSLSKDGGKVDLEVYKGQAQLNRDGKHVELARNGAATLNEKGLTENKNRLQVLSPLAGETRLLNLSRGEKLPFTWTPLPAGYHVTLEIGATRAGLQAIPESETDGARGQLKQAQKAGRWLARLRARSNDPALPELVSLVVPFTVEPKSAPLPVEPLADATVVHPQADAPTTFRWISRNAFTGQDLEVARDSQFKNVIKKTHFDGSVQTADLALPEGTYHWRVSGTLNGEDLVSPANKFDLRQHLDLKPVTLLSPADGAALAITEVKRAGVAFRWRPPTGVTQVHVKAERAREGDKWDVVYDQDVDLSTLHIGDLKVGKYRWQVSLVSETGASLPSKPFTFEVKDLPRLEWAQNGAEHLYATPAPTLRAEWKPYPAAASYRYRIAAAGDDLEAAEWSAARDTHFEADVKGDGRYQVRVEALDGHGQPAALTEPRVIEVKRQPLLPAPKWAQGTPPSLKADGKGNLSLGWDPVDGAKQYQLILKSPDGKAREQTYGRSPAAMTRMKPGRYEVEVRAFDQKDRAGELSAPKVLVVPNTSSIAAPRFKAVKVK